MNYMEQHQDNNSNTRTDNQYVRSLTEEKYKYGFTTEVDTEVIPVGLSDPNFNRDFTFHFAVGLPF